MNRNQHIVGATCAADSPAPTTPENDETGQRLFTSLYAGWLEARAKIQRLAVSLDTDAHDFDERVLRLSEVGDDFARRLAAMPTPDFSSLLAKLELLAHYLGDDAPAERGNPQLVLLAGVRADVLSMRAEHLTDITQARARIVTAIASRKTVG